jgi:hypothetical protein
MGAGPVLPALGWISSCWMTPGNITFKFLHHCSPCLFHFLLNSIFHMPCSERKLPLLLLTIFDCLPKGHQNHTASQGCPIMEKAEWNVAFATIKQCAWEIVGEGNHISSQSQLMGKIWKTLGARSLINAHRHIPAFFQSCGLHLCYLSGLSPEPHKYVLLQLSPEVT